MPSSSPSPIFPPFTTIALVGKPQAQGIGVILNSLALRLQEEGYQIILEQDTAQAAELWHYPNHSIEEIGQQASVAIVLGGDGTMLSIGRRLAAFGVPLIGINLGRLGFMTDIASSNMHPVLHAMLRGHYEVETRTLLEARVIRDKKEIFYALALNDVVVNRSGANGMVELAVSVNQSFMYNQRSDGLIVATPTGSTAYALAAGGPILHPTLGGFVLVPIAPHALSNRPIVLPDQAEISISVTSEREVFVNFDMQSLTSIQTGDCILVKRAAHHVVFLHPLGYNYFTTLREKLRWHGDFTPAA